MKIAISSIGDTVESKVDPRFGRCSYFAIYDSVSKSTSFIINPNKDVEEGAGPASVQFVANYGVTKVIAGEFGSKIKSLLNDLNIQMIAVKDDKTISEIIQSLTY